MSIPIISDATFLIGCMAHDMSTVTKWSVSKPSRYRKTAEIQFQQQLCCQNQHQNCQMISQDPIDWPLDNLQSSLLLRWWPWVLGCGGLNKIDVGLPTHTGRISIDFQISSWSDKIFCEIRHILYIYLHCHSIVSVHFLQLVCLSKCLRTTIDSGGEGER